MKRILVMGLPGAGKTYLAQHILDHLQAANKRVGWLNADDVRKQYNDWDFSIEGRIRQSLRMREMADNYTIDVDYMICDFICPIPKMRSNFAADWTVWVDTITESRYNDTDRLFVPPDHFDFRITTQDAVKWGELVARTILDNETKV